MSYVLFRFFIRLLYLENRGWIDLFWFCSVSEWPRTMLLVWSKPSTTLHVPNAPSWNAGAQRPSQKFVWWSTHQKPLFVSLQQSSSIRSTVSALTGRYPGSDSSRIFLQTSTTNLIFPYILGRAWKKFKMAPGFRCCSVSLQGNKDMKRRDPDKDAKQVPGPLLTETGGRREGDGEQARSLHPAEAKRVFSRQERSFSSDHYDVSYAVARSASTPRLHAKRDMRKGGSGKQLLRAHGTNFEGAGLLIHINGGYRESYCMQLFVRHMINSPLMFDSKISIITSAKSL